MIPKFAYWNMYPKYKKTTSTNLVNQCFNICPWILLTMLKSLRLRVSLLQIRILALACNRRYASSVLNKTRNPLTACGFHLHMRILLSFCGILLSLLNPEELAIFAYCGNRDTTNVPANFLLQFLYAESSEIL